MSVWVGGVYWEVVSVLGGGERGVGNGSVRRGKGFSVT